MTQEIKHYKTIEFGLGKLSVGTYKVEGDEAGYVGISVAEEVLPVGTPCPSYGELENGSILLKFPTDDQALRVTDALCNVNENESLHASIEEFRALAIQSGCLISELAASLDAYARASEHKAKSEGRYAITHPTKRKLERAEEMIKSIEALLDEKELNNDK